MVSISEGFGELGIVINESQILDVEKLVVHFVLRKTNPLTLDGPYLGIDPIAFTTADYNALFDIFQIHEKDVEKTIRSIHSIDRSFNVISDPFNVLSMWIVHLAYIYIKDEHVRYEFMKNILKYYHLKIFCSVVNNSFRYGTNRGIMEATLNSLTKKSDIVKYESWNRLIDSHCEKILNPKDKYTKILEQGSPDDMFLRVISDSQTALRSKIVVFARAYYDIHESGETVGSKSSVGENADGEKILTQTASVIESATSSVVTDILSVNSFVSDIMIDDISKQFSTISSRMLKTALLKINELAVIQTSSKSFDKVKKSNGETIYIGMRVLIIEIIRSMVRICRTRKINMGNKAAVFSEMQDIYSSSRVSDDDIKSVKKSVSLLIDEFNITSNEAAKSSLRLAVIYYIIYKTIMKMPS